MSDLAPEVEAKLEALAAEGFFLVPVSTDRFVIEKTHLDGTVRFDGSSVEEVIAEVESRLAAHPGAFQDTISRSDGLHETVDLLSQQAGKPEPAEGQSGTTPTPHVEKVDVSFAEENRTAEPTVDTSGNVAETPGETAEGRVGTPEDAEPAAPAPAPEGSVES